METEIHIVGLLVQTRPERQDAAAAAISGLPEVEVRGRGANGKLVVVGECGGGPEALALIAQLRGIPGVLDVALVYQHTESATALAAALDGAPCR